MIDFNNLDPTKFEEFCYDYLALMGLKNLDRRRGTGHSSTTSDQGRDIEGEEYCEDFSGDVYFRKWHIECKHYTKGVPYSVIAPGLASSDSMNVDTHLIIVSYALSNSCKNQIRQYQQNNRPSFRITYWENKNLEVHLLGRCSTLIEKYSLSFN